MAYRFNSDHREFLQLLNKHKVDYMLIGGVVVNLYGYIRGTGDVDILFKSSEQNQTKLISAVEEYGYNADELRKKDSKKIIMFTLGERTHQGHIELINRIAGVTYNKASQRIQSTDIEGITINYIHYDDLIKNKLSAGRRKDLVDVEKLHQIKEAEILRQNKPAQPTTSKDSWWAKIKKAIFSKSD